MSEYVCELPFDDVESFGSGNIQIPVRERITRCKDCVWASVPDDDGGYGDCVLACAWWMDYSRSVGELFVGKDDFCSNGETRRMRDDKQ